MDFADLNGHGQVSPLIIIIKKYLIHTRKSFRLFPHSRGSVTMNRRNLKLTNDLTYRLCCVNNYALQILNRKRCLSKFKTLFAAKNFICINRLNRQ